MRKIVHRIGGIAFLADERYTIIESVVNRPSFDNFAGLDIDLCDDSGANWIRPGSMKCRWRAVVGQQTTLIADQNLSANNMALAA